MAGLLSVGLVASGGIGAYFTYHETRALVDELQREQARSAATRIEQFIRSVERQLRGVMIVSRTAAVPAQDSHYVELIRLLRLAPAVSDAAWLDSEGRERARVSRLGRDIVAGDKDRSRDPGFISARAGQTWHGGINFRRQSEPHLAVAVPGDRRDDGVVLADINLRFVSEVTTGIQVGTSGHAYVVDAEGRLISHRDASKALRMSSLADLPQVRGALTWQRGPALLRPTIIADNENGRRALTASAPIVSLGWHVLVEQPLSEAFAPLLWILRLTSRATWLSPNESRSMKPHWQFPSAAIPRSDPFSHSRSRGAPMFWLPALLFSPATSLLESPSVPSGPAPHRRP